MTLWEIDLERMIGVLSSGMLAHINSRACAALRASLAAGVDCEGSFRGALLNAGVCVSGKQLDGAVERALRRAAEREASQ